MRPELPHPDERALAQALDEAIDNASLGGSENVPGGPVAGLAAVADSLRTALPLPPLPAGGAAEVKAAASAVRAVRRHGRAKLLVAAATTLLVGAIGGGALIGALEQPNPAAVDVTHIPAELVLAERQLGEATRR